MSDERLCYLCSAPVHRAADTGRWPRYCSDRCRNEARRLRAAVARAKRYAAINRVEYRAARIRYGGPYEAR